MTQTQEDQTRETRSTITKEQKGLGGQQQLTTPTAENTSYREPREAHN